MQVASHESQEAQGQHHVVRLAQPRWLLRSSFDLVVQEPGSRLSTVSIGLAGGLAWLGVVTPQPDLGKPTRGIAPGVRIEIGRDFTIESTYPTRRHYAQKSVPPVPSSASDQL